MTLNLVGFSSLLISSDVFHQWMSIPGFIRFHHAALELSIKSPQISDFLLVVSLIATMCLSTLIFKIQSTKVCNEKLHTSLLYGLDLGWTLPSIELTRDIVPKNRCNNFHQIPSCSFCYCFHKQTHVDILCCQKQYFSSTVVDSHN